MFEEETKEYVESLERELYAYRKLGTPERLRAVLRRDSQRRRRNRTILRWLSYIPGIISCLFIIWIFLSWLEVVTHNMTPGYIYHTYNFFQMLCG